MRVGSFGSGTVILREPRSAASASAQAVPAADPFVQRAKNDDAVRLLTRIRDTLTELTRTRPAVGVGSRTTTSVAASSAQPLGLTVAVTPAVLRSTEEVNTSTLSFSPTSPAWSGSSTGNPTVSGAYDGDQGTDTLSVVVTNVSLLGRRDMALRDSEGTTIETFSIPLGYSASDQFPLSNGLSLSFAVGEINNGDSFEIDVSSTDPQAVDVSQPFDGSGASGPNLQPGMAVTAGSFTVNGTAIAVAADDSVSTVLATINASPAGVTATFDALSESVVLTQNTGGSGPTVSVGADTSGFLAAVKLSAAVVAPGTDRQHDTVVLQDVDPFDAVSSGTLMVAGNVVTVDIGADTLTDVLSRIESQAAGVSAGYSSTTDLVTIAAESGFQLDEGTTGFFNALRIEPRSYTAARTRAGVGNGTRRDINDGVHRLTRDINALLELTGGSPFVPSAQQALTGFLEGDSMAALGLELQRRPLGTEVRFNARRLEQSLRREPRDVIATLYGKGAARGAFVQLRTMVEASLSIAQGVYGINAG